MRRKELAHCLPPYPSCRVEILRTFKEILGNTEIERWKDKEVEGK